MKRLGLLIICSLVAILGLSSCEKIGGSEDAGCNVQKAINAVPDKSTAKSLTIEGELTSEDLTVLFEIQSQLPKIENITLSTATSIPEKAFARKDGIAWGANTWLKSISAPNVTTIHQSAFARCLNLTSASFPKLETIDYAAFWSCESLTSFDFSNVAELGSEAFQACDKLNNVSLPKITELKDAVFSGCKALESLSLPVANVIDADALRSCDALVKLELGCTTDIDFSPKDTYLDTKNIDLALEGTEASKAVGKVWKDVTWKTISSNTGNIKSPVFGVAYFGCSKTFVKENETKSLTNEIGTQLIYKSGNTLWYYTFSREGEFEWGKTDYSYQYDHNSSLVTLPIREFQSEVTRLTNQFGNPTSKNEDIFAYNPGDTTDLEGHAYWFAKRIMNYSNVYVEYKWQTSEASITSTLSYYAGKTKAWGFTIKTTYYPAE